MGDLLAFTTEYKTEAELYKKMLKIYSITRGLQLTQREIEVLVRYMRNGYSKETKELIKKELKFSTNNYIHVINFHLKRKGLLETDKYNKYKKHLSPELQNIKELAENNNYNKMLPIIFNQKNS